MIQVPKFAVKPGYRPQSEDTSVENDLRPSSIREQRAIAL